MSLSVSRPAFHGLSPLLSVPCHWYPRVAPYGGQGWILGVCKLNIALLPVRVALTLSRKPLHLLDSQAEKWLSLFSVTYERGFFHKKCG